MAASVAVLAQKVALAQGGAAPSGGGRPEEEAAARRSQHGAEAEPTGSGRGTPSARMGSHRVSPYLGALAWSSPTCPPPDAFSPESVRSTCFARLQLA
eukprot:2256289-Prymnesium_polylepis.1